MAAPTDGPTGNAGSADASPANSAIPADGSAEVVPTRRAPMALVTWAFVVLVLVIVIVLLVVKIARDSAPTPTATAAATTPAPASVVNAAVTVPDLAFNTVGAPAATGPGATVLTGQPPLIVDGRPAVVYVGAEFCPYCAAERWALVVALSRFGTFHRLGATTSSAFEVFPELQTFSFVGATYKSGYISWSATEEYSQALASTAPAGFPAVKQAGPLAQSLMKRYGSDPFSGPGSATATGPGTGASLPFIDIGNKLLIEGAGIGFSPGLLQGLSMAQIATDLSDPTSPVAQAIVGAANQITAAICSTTGQAPARVCRSSGVRAGANRLGL